MTHMYGIAITYGVVSLLLLGGFAYITFKMTSKKKIFYLSDKERKARPWDPTDVERNLLIKL